MLFTCSDMDIWGYCRSLKWQKYPRLRTGDPIVSSSLLSSLLLLTVIILDVAAATIVITVLQQQQQQQQHQQQQQQQAKQSLLFFSKVRTAAASWPGNIWISHSPAPNFLSFIFHSLHPPTPTRFAFGHVMDRWQCTRTVKLLRKRHLWKMLQTSKMEKWRKRRKRKYSWNFRCFCIFYLKKKTTKIRNIQK